MSEAQAPITNQTNGAAADGELVPVTVPLPRLAVSLSGPELLRRLDALARKGKLPGYTPGATDGTGPTFSCAAFGTPFDGRLEARLADGRLSFAARLKPLVPWLFSVFMVLSVWPGVLLAESLIATYFGSVAASWTWWWYMPLTAPATPWAIWWAIKRSRALVHDDAHRVVAKLATDLGVEVLK